MQSIPLLFGRVNEVEVINVFLSASSAPISSLLGGPSCWLMTFKVVFRVVKQFSRS